MMMDGISLASQYLGDGLAFLISERPEEASRSINIALAYLRLVLDGLPSDGDVVSSSNLNAHGYRQLDIPLLSDDNNRLYVYNKAMFYCTDTIRHFQDKGSVIFACNIALFNVSDRERIQELGRYFFSCSFLLLSLIVLLLKRWR